MQGGSVLDDNRSEAVKKSEFQIFLIFSQLLSHGGGVSPNRQPNGMKIIQPRVARNELPWETRPEQDINSERVASNSNDDTGLIDLIWPEEGRQDLMQPFSGLKTDPIMACPRVARSSQPWAE